MCKIWSDTLNRFLSINVTFLTNMWWQYFAAKKWKWNYRNGFFKAEPLVQRAALLCLSQNTRHSNTQSTSPNLIFPGSSPCWHHWCPGTWGSKVEGTLQITCSTFLTYSISVSARNLLCATVSVLPYEHGGGVNRTVEEVGRLDQKKPLFRWCLLTMFLDIKKSSGRC